MLFHAGHHVGNGLLILKLVLLKTIPLIHFYYLTAANVRLYSVLAGKNGDLQNMVGFRRPDDIALNFVQKQHHTLFIADLNCPEVVNSLKKVDN